VSHAPMLNRPALILCVEDEPHLRGNIVEELVDAGYNVIEAEDGAAALEMLQEHQPELILCDITMPRMGGYELLRSYRMTGAGAADVPFVFLTALSDRVAVIEGRTAGADDYLAKPVDFDLLLAIIRTRLEQVSRIRSTVHSAAELQRRSEIETVLEHSLDALATTLEHISLGVALFDAGKTMVRKNRQAEAILGDAVTYTNGRLAAESTTHSNQLRQALDDAVTHGRNSELITITQDNRHPLLIQFIALGGASNQGAAAAMFLIDSGERPEVSETLTAHLFALTPTEARVAAAIAKGMRTDEIARDMGVSSTTLAFHMRNIFRKVGVTRQQDLMAVILRSALVRPKAASVEVATA
jgi:DNA-binding NarL/FixJ family response regulator